MDGCIWWRRGITENLKIIIKKHLQIRVILYTVTKRMIKTIKENNYDIR